MDRRTDVCVYEYMNVCERVGVGVGVFVECVCVCVGEGVWVWVWGCLWSVGVRGLGVGVFVEFVCVCWRLEGCGGVCGLCVCG